MGHHNDVTHPQISRTWDVGQIWVFDYISSLVKKIPFRTKVIETNIFPEFPDHLMGWRHSIKSLKGSRVLMTSSIVTSSICHVTDDPGGHMRFSWTSRPNCKLSYIITSVAMDDPGVISSRGPNGPLQPVVGTKFSPVQKLTIHYLNFRE